MREKSKMTLGRGPKPRVRQVAAVGDDQTIPNSSQERGFAAICKGAFAA